MKKVQKTYTAEFKREAVRLACRSPAPIAQIARELGISDTSIHEWRKQLAAHGDEAFPGSGQEIREGGRNYDVSNANWRRHERRVTW